MALWVEYECVLSTQGAATCAEGKADENNNHSRAPECDQLALLQVIGDDSSMPSRDIAGGAVERDDGKLGSSAVRIRAVEDCLRFFLAESRCEQGGGERDRVGVGAHPRWEAKPRHRVHGDNDRERDERCATGAIHWRTRPWFNAIDGRPTK
jgi:hypothetical protein